MPNHVSGQRMNQSGLRETCLVQSRGLLLVAVAGLEVSQPLCPLHLTVRVLPVEREEFLHVAAEGPIPNYVINLKRLYYQI